MTSDSENNFVRLSEIETTDRSEMICPNCGNKGLEKNIAYADEYEGKSALKYATKCPNTDCKYNSKVPSDKIEKQLPKNSLLDKIPTNVITIRNISISIIVLLAIFIFFPSSDTESTIQFEGSAENISDQDVLIHIHDNENNVIHSEEITDEEFVIEFDDTSDNSVYTAYLDYEDMLSPPGKQIDDTVTFDEPKPENHVEIDDIYDDSAELTIAYDNPYNISEHELELSIPEASNGSIIGRELSEGEYDIRFPSLLSNPEYHISYDQTKRDFSETYDYPINDNFDIYGNQETTELLLSINEDDFDLDFNEYSRTIEGSVGTETETISVDEQTALDLRFEPDQEQIQQGNINDGNDSITNELDSETVSLYIDPIYNESTENIEGTINQDDNTIEPNFGGNIETSGLSIEFLGGEVDEPLRDSISIDQTGEKGQNEQIFDVDIEGDSEYRIQMSESYEDDEFVDVFYIVNGERELITEDQQFVTVEPDSSLEIAVVTSLETIVDDTEKPSQASEIESGIDLVDFNFTDSSGNILEDNKLDEEQFSIQATFENTWNEPLSDTISIYMNNEELGNITFDIDNLEPNETVTFEPIIDHGTEVIDDTEGTHTFWVEDNGPYYLDYGIDERTFGSIEDTVEVYESDIDATVDIIGHDNCMNMSYISGGCSIEEQFDPNETNQLTYDLDDAIEYVDYEISYMKREAPENISVENIEEDIQFNGVIDENVTAEVTPIDNTITFHTDNNIGFEYTITGESADIPSTTLNGEEIDISAFQTGETYNIGQIDGNNTISFESDTGDYIAELMWSEPKTENPYPDVLLNDNIVCESSDFTGDLQCVMDNQNLDPGTQSIEFIYEEENLTGTTFEYEVEHTAKAIPQSVTIIEDNTIIADNINPDTTSTIIGNIIERGTYTIEIEVQEENNVNPSIDGEIQFPMTNTETNMVDISLNDEVILSEDNINQNDIQDLVIEEEILSLGENNIHIESDGQIRLQGTIQAYNERNVR